MTRRRAQTLSLLLVLLGFTLIVGALVVLIGAAGAVLVAGGLLVLLGLFAIPVPPREQPATRRPDGPFHGVV